jgi:antirestriction protein ArdC
MRGGERSTAVIKFGQYEREDETTGETLAGTYLRVYSVFNIAQCDGITLPPIERPNLAERIDREERVLQQVGVHIHYSDGEAFYRPSTDTVHMLRRELFRPVRDATATEMLYSVAFREVGHATGHERRLRRNLKARFGDATYAAEELVAELFAVFVMAELDLAHEPKQNSEAYLADWLHVLRADSKALMTAAAKASAAASFNLSHGQDTRRREVAQPLAA